MNTAHCEIPVRQLSDLAEGKADKYGLPLDFMERVKTFPGVVDLSGGWEIIARAYREMAVFVPADGSDYLYLDDDNESEGLDSIRSMSPEKGDDPAKFEEWRKDAIEAITCMSAQRQGLGLDAVQWIIG